MSHIPAALSKLLAEPHKLSALALWRALAIDERRRALHGVLMGTRGEFYRQQLVQHVAKLRHFRPQTLASWDAARLAAAAALGELPLPGLIKDALVELHLRERVAMLGDFLDVVEIAHESGRIAANLPDGPAALEAQLHAAAERILDRYPSEHVCTYLLTLQVQDPARWGGLALWLQTLPTRFAVAQGAEDTPEGVTHDPTGEEDAFPSLQEFTTLDRVLIRTTVDAAQGIEGALPIDALDDLIEETVQLNSSRHRTFFHVGFRDAVLRRPLQVELPAQNVERRIAYWSGYLQGLGRQERWTEIVTHFDEHDLATWFGAHAQGATAYVLFEALRRAGRSYEAAAFLTPGAVLAVPMLRIGLLTEGTHLLREDRAAEARPIFDLLATAIAAMEHLGHDTGGSFFQDARRRRANCYRQLGQLEYASHLLRELLKSAAPNVRPMVLADLGLIDAGVRRLADLVLPADRESLASFTSAIERGETRFREVLQSQDLTVGHARYCLGVLALAKGRGADAVTNLELALSLFEARANVYRLGGLLRNARLYLGIAICQTVEVHRMRRASELVREAVKEGAHIPSYLLTDTLTALSLAEDALAREVAEEILRGSSPAVLDALLNADVASGSEPIVSALLTRSMDEKRGDDARTKDACQVLPLLLQQDRTGDAAIVLDYLEEAAQRGRCRVEYIAMLEHSECLEPAWSAEDTLWCRVGILEATGRYEDAARILTQEFHRTLSVGASAGETEAEGILDRILTYGNQEHVAAPLRGRLEALRRVRGSAEQMSPDSGPGFPVRILVVGGDERQAIYDGPIREELNAVDPGITVDFIHPGWSGHWNGVLEDVKRSLARSDGVVVMRLNRTMFAREVRAACAVPWRGCGGRGKTAILNSILAVASMARQAAIRA